MARVEQVETNHVTSAGEIAEGLANEAPVEPFAGIGRKLQDTATKAVTTTVAEEGMDGSDGVDNTGAPRSTGARAPELFDSLDLFVP